MKYDHLTTNALIARWKDLGAESGSKEARAAAIASLCEEFAAPERSIIAKLASLGLYKRQDYTDKRGNPPIKKEEYVEKIANALGADLDLLESLEKVNKSVLKLILEALSSNK